MEKKLYINTVQKCCNYLFAKTQEPVKYEKLITYLENNYEAIILNQKKEFNSNKFVQSISNTLISLNDLTAPIMRIMLRIVVLYHCQKISMLLNISII